MSNIVPIRQYPVDRLRSITRIPAADRVLLSERLGEAAMRVALKPVDGARVLFEAAWGKDNALWAKRKRYLRLPGEPPSNPLDEGSYGSSGGHWAKLVETAATLLTATDAANPDRERQRHIRSLLQGTCVLPQARALPTGAEGARELIDRIAARVVERTSRETRLPELYDILRTAPFTVAPLNDEGKPLEGLEAATAAFVSSVAPDSNRRWGFTGKPDWQGKLSVDWSQPAVMLGVLARRLKHRIFVVPKALHAAIADVEDDDYEGERPGPNEAALDAWMQKIGGWRLIGKERHLPEIEFTPQRAYGWKEVDLETTRTVFLEVRPRGLGVGAWLRILADDDDDFVPVDLADIVRASLPHRKGWKDFCGYPQPMGFGFNALIWPAWIEETYAQRRPIGFDKPSAGALLGLIEDRWVEWIGWADLEGWLDDAENEELSAMLFGGADDVRFLATVSEDSDLSVPCKPASIAGAILRNLASPSNERIIDALITDAKEIADAGCGYHERIMDVHRALIETM